MMKSLFLLPGGMFQRRAAISVSDYILNRRLSSSAASKSVGTHDGSFHCDEAIACFMIRRTQKFCNADVVRTRDPLVLGKLDAVLDVGGVYDPSRDRYDHHQRGFEEVFGYGFVTKLSSAGLVYKHYGKEIIAKEVQLESDHPDVHRLYLTVYKNYIEAVDAIDNGISHYSTVQLPKFVNNTSLSSRVERMNPDWVDQNKSPAKEDMAFQQAMNLAGNELIECINFHAKSWLPARSVVIESLLARKNVDSSGEIIVLTRSVPWKLHIFELEKEMKIIQGIKYVIYPRGFDQQWLSLTFSKAIFLGNGLVAIIAGLFGNILVDTLNLGPVSPFDAASIFLAIGLAVILSSWSENYGDPSESKDLLTQFKGAAVAIASDEKIALLGAIQSLFEGSMYTFVFLWTPALSPNDEDIPHGFIFATFMLASMLGSSIAARLLARNSVRVESYMQIVFIISSASLLLPILTSLFIPLDPKKKGGGITFAGCLQLLGFCTFESCVGLFWPSIMKMRSQYIPEEARSTIMNFFRIPLNIFVCIVLYNVNAFPITVMFGMCSIFLFVASILQRRLAAIGEKPKTEDWAMMRERNSESEPLNDA